MTTKSRTVQAIESTAVDTSGDLPEWARPQANEPPTVEASTGVQVPSATPALDNLLAWLVNEVGDADAESAAGMEAIVRQVLSADNPTQVLRQTLPMDATHVLGVPMLLLDFSIRESEFEGTKSLPFYASLQVMMGEPAEPRVVNTGAIKVLAQLKRLRELDQWPQVVMIEEAAKAKKGQSAPLTLREVPAES